MKISNNMNAFIFALKPGSAEALNKMDARAAKKGTFQGRTVIEGQKGARDNVYFYVALTAIAVIGAALSTGGALNAWIALATFSAAMIIPTAKGLYDSILFYNMHSQAAATPDEVNLS